MGGRRWPFIALPTGGSGVSEPSSHPSADVNRGGSRARNSGTKGTTFHVATPTTWCTRIIRSGPPFCLGACMYAQLCLTPAALGSCMQRPQVLRSKGRNPPGRVPLAKALPSPRRHGFARCTPVPRDASSASATFGHHTVLASSHCNAQRCRMPTMRTHHSGSVFLRTSKVAPTTSKTEQTMHIRTLNTCAAQHSTSSTGGRLRLVERAAGRARARVACVTVLTRPRKVGASGRTHRRCSGHQHMLSH